MELCPLWKDTDIFHISMIMNACKPPKKKKKRMFALITIQQNWNVLLRGFGYLKYVGKMIKSPGQQGGGMGSSSQKTEIMLLKKESINKIRNFGKRRKSM